jgi:hypothetical protein
MSCAMPITARMCQRRRSSALVGLTSDMSFANRVVSSPPGRSRPAEQPVPNRLTRTQGRFA